jgi:hypothetical protein
VLRHASLDKSAARSKVGDAVVDAHQVLGVLLHRAGAGVSARLAFEVVDGSSQRPELAPITGAGAVVQCLLIQRAQARSCRWANTPCNGMGVSQNVGTREPGDQVLIQRLKLPKAPATK